MSTAGRPAAGGSARARSSEPAARKIPAPARKQAAPASRNQAPTARNQTSASRTQAPAARKPAPASRQSPPPARKAATSGAPVARKPAPATRKPAPAARKAAPAARKAAPARRSPPSALNQPGLAPARRAPASGRSARTTTALRTGAPRPRSGGGGPRRPGPPGPPLFRLPPARIGNPDRRLRLALVAAMVVFTVFGARLFQLQGLDASELARRALDSRTKTDPLPAPRGDIRDASGAVLATTVERRNITVDQLLVAEYNVRRTDLPAAQKGAAGAALVLAPVLNLSRSTIEKRLTGKRRFAYLAKDVEPAVWTAVNRMGIPGIFGPKTSRRTYPNGPVAAPVLGFLGKDGTPLAGVEKSYNQVLQGVDGTYTYERGANGQPIGTGSAHEVAPVPGRDIQLTIDRDLQYQADELVAKQVKYAKAKAGTVVVMDSRNFNVLALANAPTFDPNDPGGSSRDDLENRALVDVFEPGSTSKVITAAAAIEECKASPGTRVVVPGVIQRGDTPFHDSHPHGTEQLTLAGILAKSSNIGTIKIGERMTQKTLHDYLTKFGYGSRTGVGVAESPGILTPVDKYSATTPYTVMFGQGVSVTALQAATVYATIANDGVRKTPRLIKAVGGSDGELHDLPAGPETRVVSPETAKKVRQMLETVVSEEGTAATAEVPGYRVAGKTGTADFYDEKVGRYNGFTASFIGIAPADKPRLVIAVFLQQPQNGHYGGTLAAPVFQKLMTYALAQESVPSSGTKPPKVKLYWP